MSREFRAALRVALFRFFVRSGFLPCVATNFLSALATTGVYPTPSQDLLWETTFRTRLVVKNGSAIFYRIELGGYPSIKFLTWGLGVVERPI